MPKKHRIKDAKISFVSLCRRGANLLPALFKTFEGPEESICFQSMAKFEPSKNELYAVVYLPDKEDAQGHSADADAIRKMAHSFLQSGAQLDTNHDRRPLDKGQAYVAESTIIQKGDERFAHLGEDATGGWGMVIKLEDPELQKRYAQEGWQGVSLFSYPGDYSLEAIEKSSTDTELDMDETKLQALVKSTIEGLDLGKVITAQVNATLDERFPKPDKDKKSDDDDKDKKPVSKAYDPSEPPVFPADATTSSMLKYELECAEHEAHQEREELKLALPEALDREDRQEIMGQMREVGTELAKRKQEIRETYRPRRASLEKRGTLGRDSEGLDMAKEIEEIDASLAELGVLAPEFAKKGGSQ